MQTLLIALTGGIGAGKSIVATILRKMGYPVYDSDLMARQIMESSDEIRRRLVEEISPMAVREDGTLDRTHIASIVFSSEEKLKRLNSMVHGAVLEDLRLWHQSHHGQFKVVFVETAILRSSGMYKMVDGQIEVTAPEEVRVERVMDRNSMTREEVLARIRNQKEETPLEDAFVIVNDGIEAVLPQIQRFLEAQ